MRSKTHKDNLHAQLQTAEERVGTLEEELVRVCLQIDGQDDLGKESRDAATRAHAQALEAVQAELEKTRWTARAAESAREAAPALEVPTASAPSPSPELGSGRVGRPMWRHCWRRRCAK